jgi:hypothetical protein
MMSDYNREQYTTLQIVTQHLKDIESLNRSGRLSTSLSNYLAFRRTIDEFLQNHFSSICHEKCYHSQLSACCSKEGIITFFADVVVNAKYSSPDEIDHLFKVLQNPQTKVKCVYLGEHGCLWRIKPIVCTMFICDRAQDEVFGRNPDLRSHWEKLERLKKRFTWPDRPVLFDDLERCFIEAGHQSSLMYLHNSPGLIRVKKSQKKLK